MASEICRDQRFGEVLDLESLSDRRGELKALSVCGEENLAILGEATHGVPDQRLVVLVDVEVARAHLRTRESRGIDEYPIEVRTILRQPTHRIAAKESVPVGIEAIDDEVPPSPFEIRIRQIDAGRLRCATCRRSNAHRAGVGKQIEHALVSTMLERIGANHAMIHEEAGIDTVFEIDDETQRPLTHRHLGFPLRDTSILISLLVLAPHFDHDVSCIDSQSFRKSEQDVLNALFGAIVD